MHSSRSRKVINVHLVVEDLGLASGGVGDEGLIQNIEDILADLLELLLDLHAVLLDGSDVLVGALGLFLLLDRGDDAPRGTAGADDVLVGDAEKVALVDGELAAELGNLLHVGDHLIVALGLLAEASQEGLAVLRFTVSHASAWVRRARVGSKDPKQQDKNKPFTLEGESSASSSFVSDNLEERNGHGRGEVSGGD